MSLETTLGYQTLSGYSTYQIGGNTNFDKEGTTTFHFPISELKFPINAGLTSFKLAWEPMERLQLVGQVGSNFNWAYAGSLEDSDWLEDVTQKDIFSTSRADLRVSQGLGSVVYRLNRVRDRGDFWLGFLYHEQTLDYLASQLTQVSLTDESVEPILVTGNVIGYQRTTKIHYVTLSSEYRFGAFGEVTVVAGIGYSPWAYIQDRDDHLLRKKASTGTLRGTATSAHASVMVPVAPDWRLALGVNHELVETHGTQVQSRYEKTSEGDPGFITEIDARAFSRVTTLYGYLSFKPMLVYSESIVQTSNSYQFWVCPYWSADSIGSYAHPSLGVEFPIMPHLFLGSSFEQSSNKVSRALSEGVMTQWPVYGRIRFQPMENVYVNLGGGYTFVGNQIDSQAKTDLARNGFSNASERVESYGFGFIEIEYPITSEWSPFVQAKFANTTVQFRSDPYQETQFLSMSQIQAGLRIRTAL